MDVDDVYELLEWLEETSIIKLRFRDKRELAEAFVEQRSYRIWDEYQRERKREQVGT